ncbi:hypothetical protein B296_00019249 [Ensete ventricosum]|uniref:MIR domain-containing protein n=1 Tax=Ensete ventricosum TaxID=4639 RepID=A0A427AY79_ENSVE|nr:hypothetical protein B296_00019249 [Ensete ventricosum]
MALSVLFALSALLLLGLDEVSVRPASAVAADVVEVCDDKPHISRSVMLPLFFHCTFFAHVDNYLQIVRPQPDSSARQGDIIETGAIIRLQHMKTRRWLHSHLHASPLSGNLEVSEFTCAFSRRYVVFGTNGPITSGWQQRVCTSQLVQASDQTHSGDC